VHFLKGGIPLDIPLKKEQSAELLYNDTCEANDYLIAAACGAISGMVDIFLVGAPGESLLGQWTDAQADRMVMKFAKMNGWSSADGKGVTSAIGYLERNFKVNYDQRYGADVGGVINMSTKNHHLKSLAHSPDIVGLFFSILNQFTSTSTFLSGGQLVTVRSDTFELQGGNPISKLFCGVANGGRGTGVAIPFFALFQTCTFGKFDIGKDKQDLATLATRAFQEGYDARFGLAMAIPVLLCDLSIRLIWAIRQHFQKGQPIKECIPTAQHNDLRVMLLVGNGTLCVMDGADAAIRSGGNWLTFFTRLNLLAWFRFLTLVLKELCIRLGISQAMQKYLDAFQRVGSAVHDYLQQLEQYDIDGYVAETKRYAAFTAKLEETKDEEKLNQSLKAFMLEAEIPLPWSGDFDEFMGNPQNHLEYK
jgi:hypothetical protein